MRSLLTDQINVCIPAAAQTAVNNYRSSANILFCLFGQNCRLLCVGQSDLGGCAGHGDLPALLDVILLRLHEQSGRRHVHVQLEPPDEGSLQHLDD